MLEEKTEKYWFHFPDLIEYAIHISFFAKIFQVYNFACLPNTIILSSLSDNDANGLVTG